MNDVGSRKSYAVPESYKSALKEMIYKEQGEEFPENFSDDLVAYMKGAYVSINV